MRARKIILWGALVLLAAILLVAGLLYIQASRVPDDYRPLQLTRERRDEVAKDFIEHQVADFSNRVEENSPFEWKVTEAELNEYLASIEEIAFQAGQPKGTGQAVEDAGLSGMCVALHENQVVVMARSTKHDKVVSGEFSFEFTPDGKLKIRLGRVRLGRLTLPERFYRERMARLSRKLRDDAEAKEDPPDGPGMGGAITPSNLRGMAAAMLSAVDGEPIEPVGAWSINDRPARIEAIDVTEGEMTLHVRPQPRSP